MPSRFRLVLRELLHLQPLRCYLTYMSSVWQVLTPKIGRHVQYEASYFNFPKIPWWRPTKSTRATYEHAHLHYGRAWQEQCHKHCSFAWYNFTNTRTFLTDAYMIVWNQKTFFFARVIVRNTNITFTKGWTIIYVWLRNNIPVKVIP